MANITSDDLHRLWDNVENDDFPLDLGEVADEKTSHRYLPAGALRAFCTAVLLHLVETCLSADQQWLCFMIIIHFLDDVNSSGFGMVFTLWKLLEWPSVSYLICIAADRYLYPGLLLNKYEKDEPRISVIYYLGWLVLFKSGSSLQLLTTWTPPIVIVSYAQPLISLISSFQTHFHLFK